MKTHIKTTGNSVRTPLRLGWLSLIPLLATSLPAQPTGPDLTIEHSTNGTCLLTWPVTTSNYVVLSTTNLEGTWVPCLNHVSEAAGLCHMSVAAPHRQEYFRLVEGYYDDFEDGELEGWMLYCMDPAFENIVNLDVTNGHLRIHGTWSGERQVYCLYTNLTLRNCAVSLDILDWANGSTNSIHSALLTCFETGVVTTNRQHYYSGVSVTPPDSPTQSSIWAFKWWGTGGQSGGEEFFPKINPANDYRLTCSLVDGQMIVEIYDLTELSTPLQTLIATTDNSPLAAGWPGIFANDKGSGGLLDITFDNFVIYALP